MVAERERAGRGDGARSAERRAQRTATAISGQAVARHRALYMALAAAVWLAGCTASTAPADTLAADTVGADTVAADTASSPTSGSFSVLTYNVHGLPSFITGDDTTARMKEIAPRLDAFDLVGLQEDFIDGNHAILAAAVTHTTQEHYDDVLPERAYGSGLTVFARATALASEGRHFSTCVGLLDHASDCLASKGFLFVRLQLAVGAAVDVYVTHLEAGGGDEDMTARQVQVDELLAGMAALSAGRAVLFMGDTNLRFGDGDADAALLAHIEAGTGLQRVCAALDCPEPDHIDRIYFRSGAGVVLTPASWRVVNGFVDPQGVELSDHPPVAATLTWQAAVAP